MLRLKQFRVIGFRSVRDSEWVETDTVTALIGTNESGKTNLLLPLWKLRPAKNGEIDRLADYPRREYNKLRGHDEGRVFIRAQFDLTPELRVKLWRLTGVDATRFTVLECARCFDGTEQISFPGAEPERTVSSASVEEITRLVKTAIEGDTPAQKEQPLKAAMLAALENVLNTLKSAEELDAPALANVLAILSEVGLDAPAARSTIVPRWEGLKDKLKEVVGSIGKRPPSENAEAVALMQKHLPAFVYYSNYGNLDSEIYLPHVIDNMSREDLGAKEEAKARTLKVLFEFVGLKPDEILELGKAASPPGGAAPTPTEIGEAARRTKERSVLLQSASSSLTAAFREWWKQGDYKFRFEADGDHFRIWVSDDKRPEEVELESRSTGLQWFLSFFLVFLVESRDAHEGAILLLDEPGLSLHPLAQRDLSGFFDNLSTTNQLLYTTHSPFLVDPDRIDRVRAVYVDPKGATAVSPDLRASSKTSPEGKSVYAVHAALGLSVSDGLLQGCTTVIVEGSSDQIYMTAIKTILIAKGLIKPQREIVFLPGGGAKGVAALVPILCGKDEEPPYVLLDSDGPGLDFAKKLRSGSIYSGENGKRISCVGELLAGMPGAEIEDLMPHEIFVDVVSRAHRGEQDFGDVAKSGVPLVPQIEANAAKNDVILVSPGWKVDLARAVKARLLKEKEIPEETMALWVKSFAPFAS